MTSCKQRLPAMDFVYSYKSNVLFMCYVYVTVCVLFTSSVLYKLDSVCYHNVILRQKRLLHTCNIYAIGYNFLGTGMNRYCNNKGYSISFQNIIYYYSKKPNQSSINSGLTSVMNMALLNVLHELPFANIDDDLLEIERNESATNARETDFLDVVNNRYRYISVDDVSTFFSDININEVGFEKYEIQHIPFLYECTKPY